jgi:AcrR family transcriptional regulator
MPRPRSARAHAQVLEAASRLFAERGIEGTSMDAIAGASGVSKATIYKHWADKDALVLEVMAHLHASVERPVVTTGDVRADIVAFLDWQPPRPKSDLRGRLMPHLMAYAASHPDFGRQWRACALEPQRAHLVELLGRAVREGRLAPTLDVELAAIALLGPMLYRNVHRLMGGELPRDFAARIVGGFWNGAEADRRTRS